MDDLLAGSDTVEGAVKLQKELSRIFTRAGFTLIKFRSQVLSQIPQELVEPMPQMELMDCYTSKYPKALGVKWNSENDTMAVDGEDLKPQREDCWEIYLEHLMYWVGFTLLFST